MSVLERYPALAYPLYRRFWLASLGSVGGWQIASLAMGWLVFELSDSTLDLGILGAATALPAILMTVAGGVVADRFDKRMVLLWTTLSNTGLLFLLAFLQFAGVIAVWHIWMTAAAISVVSGIDWPTRQSFFPNLIDRPAMLSAVALNSVLWQVTRMVLPAVGGVLLAWYDASLIFALAGMGYLGMWLVLYRIELILPGERGDTPLQQTLQGIRFILNEPLFRNLILLSYATMLFLSSYMQLMPAFAKLLDAGPGGFGMLMSATGVGSILGTVCVGALNPGNNYGRIMLGAALGAVVMLSCFAIATLLPNYFLGVLFALLAAGGTSVFLILSTTALQAKVPDRLRGRVMGIHGITYSLMPMGALATGAIAVKTGTPVALLIGLAAYLVIFALLGLRAQTVRSLATPLAEAPLAEAEAPSQRTSNRPARTAG